MIRLQFRQILTVLARHGVEFIVVGGVSAGLQGSPLSTFDLDIVHRRSAENIGRVLAALDDIQAKYRLRPDLSPTAGHLASTGHQLLSTNLGPLDVSGSIGHGWDYEKLLPFGRVLKLRGAGDVFLLKLDKLIEVKEETAGDKDRAQLPILKQVLKDRKA